VSGEGRQRVRPYLGKEVIDTPARVAGMPAGSDHAEPVPPSDHPRLRAAGAARPAQFRPAQTYALAAVALGLVVYLAMRLAEPAAMTSKPPPIEPPSDPHTALFAERAP